MSPLDQPESRRVGPLVQGYGGAVVAGHPAAALVGLDVLRAGGNAVDAGVATGLAMTVLLSHECGFFGVAPTLVYLGDTGEVINFDGTGVWPEGISLDMFEDLGGSSGTTEVLHTLTPGTPDAWITALARFGTRSFAESAAPAIALAEHGFPMYPYLHRVLSTKPANYRRWPGSAAVFFPGGELPRLGVRFVQRDLAATLGTVCQAEQAAAGRGRAAGLRGARDCIYKGELAQRYVEYCRGEGGVLTLQDMAEYEGRCEEPSRVTYRGLDVYSTGVWGQGPVFPQALKILEGYDLSRHGAQLDQLCPRGQPSPQPGVCRPRGAHGGSSLYWRPAGRVAVRPVHQAPSRPDRPTPGVGGDAPARRSERDEGGARCDGSRLRVPPAPGRSSADRMPAPPTSASSTIAATSSPASRATAPGAARLFQAQG